MLAKYKNYNEWICVHCRAEDRLSNRNCNLVDNSVVMSLINQSMNRQASHMTLNTP